MELREIFGGRAASLRLGEGWGLGAFTKRGKEFSNDEGVGDHGEDFALATATTALSERRF
jgi:hypothetical protein